MLDKFRTTISKAKVLTEDINKKLGEVKGNEEYAQLVSDSTELRKLIDQFKLDSNDNSDKNSEETLKEEEKD